MRTDDSKFEVFRSERRVFVRQQINKKLSHDCVVPIILNEGIVSSWAWEYLGNNMTKELIKINGILKKDAYLKNFYRTGNSILDNA